MKPNRLDTLLAWVKDPSTDGSQFDITVRDMVAYLEELQESRAQADRLAALLGIPVESAPCLADLVDRVEKLVDPVGWSQKQPQRDMSNFQAEVRAIVGNSLDGFDVEDHIKRMRGGFEDDVVEAAKALAEDMILWRDTMEVCPVCEQGIGHEPDCTADALCKALGALEGAK